MGANNHASEGGLSRRLQLLALIPPALLAAGSVGGGFVIRSGLAEYTGSGAISVVAGTAGVLISLLLAVLLLRSGSAVPIMLVLTMSVGLTAAAGWSWRSGKVTGEKFGWTVCGALPIPALDVTIRPDGRLGFRSKSHDITTAEVRRMVDAGAVIVVIGIGWNEAARVAPEVLELPGVEVIVLPTPQAHAEFNRLRKTGAKVALLSHSTC